MPPSPTEAISSLLDPFAFFYTCVPYICGDTRTSKAWSACPFLRRRLPEEYGPGAVPKGAGRSLPDLPGDGPILDYESLIIASWVVATLLAWS
jgi:hypothetical protein